MLYYSKIMKSEEKIIQKIKMSFPITVFSILNSVRFVTSTLTKTET